MRPHFALGAMVVAGVSVVGCGADDEVPPRFETTQALGEALFRDPQLSLDGTQSCATCHDPSHAFVDVRVEAEGVRRAVSLGDDGVSLGDRNAPSVAYAALGTALQVGRRERLNSQSSAYEGRLGGFFWDGRAVDLADQAGGPPLNPLEMGMPNPESVVARVFANPDYVDAFTWHYGEAVFDDDDRAYTAMTEAIADYERSPSVSSFDSRYDRSLEDPLNDALSLKEGLGKALFFSETDTNCATCHQVALNSNRSELFAAGEFHNIGVPVNTAVRDANGLGRAHVDHGLMRMTRDPDDDGKFKTPTLRNVAVTGPYMHNGAFADLRTVVLFYDHHFTASTHPINPETNARWAEPEVPATVNLEALREGGALDDFQIDALVCFLRTLTDARYEHLMPPDELGCAD
ncbi:MAG: cytochrome c peroxidase [Myxococcota bacterium]